MAIQNSNLVFERVTEQIGKKAIIKVELSGYSDVYRSVETDDWFVSRRDGKPIDIEAGGEAFRFPIATAEYFFKFDGALFAVNPYSILDLPASTNAFLELNENFRKWSPLISWRGHTCTCRIMEMGDDDVLDLKRGLKSFILDFYMIRFGPTIAKWIRQNLVVYSIEPGDFAGAEKLP